MTGGQGDVDLRRYLRALWRRKLPFLACVVLIPLAVYLVSSSLQKTYESSTTLQLRTSSLELGLFSEGAAPSTSTVLTAARLIETAGFARRAAERLGEAGGSPEELLSRIAVEADPETGFLTIVATANDALRAQEIALAFARSLTVGRRQQAVREIGGAIRRLEDQLAELPPADSVAREQLSQQIQELRAVAAAQRGNTRMVSAPGPGEVVAPSPVRNTVLGLIVALLVAVALVALIEALDRKLRRAEEIEELTGAPLLAVVPEQAFHDGTAGSATREAFQMLRASLAYFNLDRPIESVLVTSAGKEDGKTTVATNLAVAAARAGSDVLLIDADLRLPSVTARLEVDAGGGAGLSEVLVGERDLGSALVEHPVEGAEGRLRVLPSGHRSPNPPAMLGSNRMRELMAEAAGHAELVIVDTTPLLVVADAVPLVDQVSGVLLVARLGQTSRDALERSLRVVGTAGGTALGAVATGAGGGSFGYGYDYGYGYGEEDGAGRSARRLRGGLLRRRRRRARRVSGERAEPPPAEGASGGTPAGDGSSVTSPRG